MNPLRILLVDDEEDLVLTLQERLQLRGFDAEGVVSGMDALERIEEKSFDVILLDLKMPGISGLTVMKRIRQDHPDVGFVLFTGHGSLEEAEEGVQLGAFSYLVKPFNIDDLVSTIRQAAARLGRA